MLREDEVLRIKYSIDFPGDESAGMLPFCDDIEVIVESGNPGGENGEFEDFIRQALEQWYDGPWVELVSVKEEP